jgi:hypothetical protein
LFLSREGEIGAEGSGGLGVSSTAESAWWWASHGGGEGVGGAEASGGLGALPTAESAWWWASHGGGEGVGGAEGSGGLGALPTAESAWWWASHGGGEGGDSVDSTARSKGRCLAHPPLLYFPGDFSSVDGIEWRWRCSVPTW